MASAPYTFSHPSAATYPPPLFHGAPFPYSASTQIHGYTYPPPFPIVPHPSPPPPAFPYAAAYPYPPPASAYASPTGSSPAHNIPPPQTHVPPPPLYCPFPTPMCSTAAAPMALIPPDEAAKNGLRNDPTVGRVSNGSFGPCPSSVLEEQGRWQPSGEPTAPPPRWYATPPLAPSSPPGAGVTPPFPPVQGMPYSSPPPGSTTPSYPSPPGSSTSPGTAAPPPPTSGESPGHTMPPSQGSPPSTGYQSPSVSFPSPAHHTSSGRPIHSLHHHHSPPTSDHLLVHAAPQPTVGPTAPNQERRPPKSYASSGTLSVVNASLNHHFFKEDDAVIQAVADIHVPAKDGTHHWLQSELLNIQVRLCQQQARERTSFNTLQAIPGSSPLEVTCTAPIAPKLYDIMPTPSSGYDNLSVHSDQSPAMQDGGTNPREQNLDELPQAYGLHNLNCRTVVRADGTEHSYFTLPADYPLERVVREPVFDVYDDESDGCSNEFVQVFTGSSEQKTYEVPENYPLPQATSRQMCAIYDEKTEGETDESADVFTTTPKQQSHEEERQEGVQDYTLELQQKDDERECNCPVIKASDSSATRSSQLSVEHSMSELRMKWDPGDTRLHVLFTTASNLSPIAEINNPASGSIVMAPIASYELHTDEIEVKVDSGKPILGPERSTDGVFSFTNEEKSVCRTATWHSISFFPWDPRATESHVLFTTAAGAIKLHDTDAYTSEFTCSYKIQKLVNTLVNLKMILLPSWNLQLNTPLKLLTQSLCANTTMQVTEHRHHLEFTLLAVMLLHGSVFTDGQLVYMPQGTSSASSKWVSRMVIGLSCRFPSFEMAKLRWDPGITRSSDMYSLLEILSAEHKTVKQKHFWAYLLLQHHSWCTSPNAFRQLRDSCLPIVLDCLHSEPFKQLDCYSSIFSSTAMYMSTATHVHMRLVLSSAKIAQAEKDAATMYQVLKIQLPMSKTCHIWDPGIESILFLYEGLHIMIQQVDYVSALLPLMRITANCPSNIIQGVQENYNAKHLVLSSQDCVKIREIDIIFMTFLPP